MRCGCWAPARCDATSRRKNDAGGRPCSVWRLAIATPPGDHVSSIMLDKPTKTLVSELKFACAGAASSKDVKSCSTLLPRMVEVQEEVSPDAASNDGPLAAIEVLSTTRLTDNNRPFEEGMADATAAFSSANMSTKGN